MLTKINDLIKVNLALQQDMCIENAHRTGKSDSSLKPRHIIVKFLYRHQRAIVLKKARQLHDKSFFIIEDLPIVDAKKKRSLKDVMSKAFQEGKHPNFRNGTL